MKIGVLTLQGGFAEHIHMLRKLEVETVEVRLPQHLEGLDGLIIPGGESTTIGKLAVAYGLIDPLRAFAKQKAVWGTCAGAIFLAKQVGRDQPTLRLMDISIARNAFGSQISSFETELAVPALSQIDTVGFPYRAVFIRAPIIEAVHQDAKILAALPDGRIVAAQQGRWLATVFHPELTPDTRFHQYFLHVARGETERSENLLSARSRMAYLTQ